MIPVLKSVLRLPHVRLQACTEAGTKNVTALDVHGRGQR